MCDLYINNILEQINEIPATPGCYFVYSITKEIHFTNKTTAKETYTKKEKGKTKIVSQITDAKLLQCLFDTNNSKTLYIGKATSLKKRLKQLYDTAIGKSINHHGGCRLWQIQDWNYKLKFCFIECDTKDTAEALEYYLINEFSSHHNNQKPVANIVNGKKSDKPQEIFLRKYQQTIKLFCGIDK